MNALADALECSPDDLQIARDQFVVAAHDIPDVVAVVRAAVVTAGLPNRDTAIAEAVAAVLAMADTWPADGPSFEQFIARYLPDRVGEIAGR